MSRRRSEADRAMTQTRLFHSHHELIRSHNSRLTYSRDSKIPFFFANKLRSEPYHKTHICRMHVNRRKRTEEPLAKRRRDDVLFSMISWNRSQSFALGQSLWLCHCLPFLVVWKVCLTGVVGFAREFDSVKRLWIQNRKISFLKTL